MDEPNSQHVVNMQQVTPMITVITDASWCPEIKCAGWAVWVVCDGQRLQNSGAVMPQVASSGDAEFIALVHGLDLALQSFRPQKRTKVLVQSDSIDALRYFENRCKQQKEFAPTARWWVRQAEIRLAALLASTPERMLYETRHVKGHSNSKQGARFYVNNWADEEAKKQMRLIRDRVRGKR